MLNYIFGGKAEEEKKDFVENADPMEAMKEAIDNHGDFETEVDGSLKADDVFFIQEVVLRQAKRSLKSIQAAQVTERLEMMD